MISQQKYLGEVWYDEDGNDVVLSCMSPRHFYRTNGGKVTLPDARKLQPGAVIFTIWNDIYGSNFAIDDYDGNPKIALTTGYMVIACLVDNSTSAGEWFFQGFTHTGDFGASPL